MSRRELQFVKYSGAGNDFLIVDEAREPGIGEASQQARGLCRRGTSVGADGLIVLTTSDLDPELGGVARMHLWNANGTSAEFSGNAARCCVRYLVDEGRAGGDEVLLETDIGLVRGQVENGTATVAVPGIARVYPQQRIRVEGRDLMGTYVRVGVPFFVLLHDDPDDLPVRFLGRAIREHRALAPEGANVDFVRIDDDQNLYFRVYERGVEDETLSSGTGSISAALAAAALGRVAAPVACQARGGTLTVRFRPLTDKEIAELRASTNDEELEDERLGETAVQPESATGSDDDEAGVAGDPAADGSDEGEEEAVEEEPVARVGRGEPLLFGDIRLEGETRRVMAGVAFSEALRLS